MNLIPAWIYNSYTNIFYTPNPQTSKPKEYTEETILRNKFGPPIFIKNKSLQRFIYVLALLSIVTLTMSGFFVKTIPNWIAGIIFIPIVFSVFTGVIRKIVWKYPTAFFFGDNVSSRAIFIMKNNKPNELLRKSLGPYILTIGLVIEWFIVLIGVLFLFSPLLFPGH